MTSPRMATAVGIACFGFRLDCYVSTLPLNQFKWNSTLFQEDVYQTRLYENSHIPLLFDIAIPSKNVISIDLLPKNCHCNPVTKTYNIIDAHLIERG